ncbi:MAG: hypothetical protein COV07_04530 [Candidatus Vogelbacteria bacterium CG10_big_fil_rev_8_21_14_0_10_45_14]|uniref:Uncharacterized protein n=1 Tax=Candidatus Vogelbacteria bacterium CG10_big_fil_rev_8_21_14_0_10_45_14 TaxID=1975042 RepID=A0A2H0RJM3_9BACT|nr:MAG: hypothetical protein COV07_04530 [Candidatus Vogelbacteria bacterium CG10_big_fil_rev_8_21_14_0_10_45_14]
MNYELKVKKSRLLSSPSNLFPFTFSLSPSNRFGYILSTFLIVLAFVPQGTVFAQAQPVSATFTGDIAPFFMGPFGSDDIIIDPSREYMRGTIRLVNQNGDAAFRMDGTLHPETYVIDATLSGHHDWNYAEDKSDRQKSYLRTVIDGTWKPTLAERSGVNAPYVWSGPMTVEFQVVIAKATPDDVAVPEENKTYDGTMTIVVDSSLVNISISAPTSSVTPLPPLSARADVVAAEETDNAGILVSSEEEGSKSVQKILDESSELSKKDTTPRDDSSKNTILALLLILGLAGIIALAWPKRGGEAI